MEDRAEPSGSFRRIGPNEAITPVLIAVPHAGRDYPLALRAQASAPIEQLMAMEDRFADLLVEEAAVEGTTVLIANRARCWIDLNRDEREIDPSMIYPQPRPSDILSTVKSRGGLGLIPRRLPGGGEILRSRIGAAELRARIDQDHRPWHGAIAAALAQRRAAFGAALLIDCHSMPPIRRTASASAPDFVIGDRHGQSAGRRLIDVAVAIAEAVGLTVALNAPYAGGHTLDRHGRPEYGVHAMQIEVDRSLYLGRDLRAPGPGLRRLQATFARIARAMAAELGAASPPLAAE